MTANANGYARRGSNSATTNGLGVSTSRAASNLSSGASAMMSRRSVAAAAAAVDSQSIASARDNIPAYPTTGQPYSSRYSNAAATATATQRTRQRVQSDALSSQQTTPRLTGDNHVQLGRSTAGNRLKQHSSLPTGQYTSAEASQPLTLSSLNNHSSASDMRQQQTASPTHTDDSDEMLHRNYAASRRAPSQVHIPPVELSPLSDADAENHSPASDDNQLPPQQSSTITSPMQTPIPKQHHAKHRSKHQKSSLTGSLSDAGSSEEGQRHRGRHANSSIQISTLLSPLSPLTPETAAQDIAVFQQHLKTNVLSKHHQNTYLHEVNTAVSEDTIARLEDRCSELQRNLQAKDLEMSLLKERNHVLQSEIQSVSDETKQLRSERDQLTGQYEALQQSQREAKQQNQQLTSRLQQRIASEEEVKKHVQQLEATLQTERSARTDLEKHQSAHYVNTEQYNAVKTEAYTHLQSIQQLQQRLSSLQQELHDSHTTAQQSLQQLQTKSVELQHAADDVQRLKEQRELLLQQHQQTLAAKDETLNTVKSELQHYRRETTDTMQTLQSTLKQRDAATEQLQQQCRELQQQLLQYGNPSQSQLPSLSSASNGQHAHTASIPYEEYKLERSRLMQQMEEQKILCNQHMREVESLRQQYNESSAEIASLTGSRRELTERCRDTEERLYATLELKSGLDVQCTTLSEQLQKLTNETEITNTNCATKNGCYASRLLESQVAAKSQALDTLQKRYEALEQRQHTAHTGAMQWQHKYEVECLRNDSVEQRNNDLQQQANELQLKIVGLHAQVAALESEAQHTQQLHALSQRFDTLDSTLHALPTTVIQSYAQYMGSEEAIQQFADRVDTHDGKGRQRLTASAHRTSVRPLSQPPSYTTEALNKPRPSVVKPPLAFGSSVPRYPPFVGQQHPALISIGTTSAQQQSTSVPAISSDRQASLTKPLDEPHSGKRKAHKQGGKHEDRATARTVETHHTYPVPAIGDLSEILSPQSMYGDTPMSAREIDDADDEHHQLLTDNKTLEQMKTEFEASMQQPPNPLTMSLSQALGDSSGGMARMMLDNVRGVVRELFKEFAVQWHKEQQPTIEQTQTTLSALQQQLQAMVVEHLQPLPSTLLTIRSDVRSTIDTVSSQHAKQFDAIENTQATLHDQIKQLNDVTDAKHRDSLSDTQQKYTELQQLLVKHTSTDDLVNTMKSLHTETLQSLTNSTDYITNNISVAKDEYIDAMQSLATKDDVHAVQQHTEQLWHVTADQLSDNLQHKLQTAVNIELAGTKASYDETMRSVLQQQTADLQRVVSDTVQSHHKEQISDLQHCIDERHQQVSDLINEKTTTIMSHTSAVVNDAHEVGVDRMLASTKALEEQIGESKDALGNQLHTQTAHITQLLANEAKVHQSHADGLHTHLNDLQSLSSNETTAQTLTGHHYSQLHTELQQLHTKLQECKNELLSSSAEHSQRITDTLHDVVDQSSARVQAHVVDENDQQVVKLLSTIRDELQTYGDQIVAEVTQQATECARDAMSHMTSHIASLKQHIDGTTASELNCVVDTVNAVTIAQSDLLKQHINAVSDTVTDKLSDAVSASSLSNADQVKQHIDASLQVQSQQVAELQDKVQHAVADSRQQLAAQSNNHHASLHEAILAHMQRQVIVDSEEKVHASELTQQQAQTEQQYVALKASIAEQLQEMHGSYTTMHQHAIDALQTNVIKYVDNTVAAKLAQLKELQESSVDKHQQAITAMQSAVTTNVKDTVASRLDALRTNMHELQSDVNTHVDEAIASQISKLRSDIHSDAEPQRTLLQQLTQQHTQTDITLTQCIDSVQSYFFNQCLLLSEHVTKEQSSVKELVYSVRDEIVSSEKQAVRDTYEKQHNALKTLLQTFNEPLAKSLHAQLDERFNDIATSDDLMALKQDVEHTSQTIVSSLTQQLTTLTRQSDLQHLQSSLQQHINAAVFGLPSEMKSNVVLKSDLSESQARQLAEIEKVLNSKQLAAKHELRTDVSDMLERYSKQLSEQFVQYSKVEKVEAPAHVSSASAEEYHQLQRQLASVQQTLHDIAPHSTTATMSTLR